MPDPLGWEHLDERSHREHPLRSVGTQLTRPSGVNLRRRPDLSSSFMGSFLPGVGIDGGNR